MGSFRNDIAEALMRTAEQLSPGSGKDAVRRADMYLGDIEGMPHMAVYDGLTVELASPIYVEEKRPDGDPVTINKKREGLIVGFEGGFILARDLSFARTKTEDLSADEVSAEPVTAILDGKQMPGIRVRGHSGKPYLTIGIGQIRECDPSEQVAVRDRILGLLSIQADTHTM